jgi:hypothetical protein
MHRRERGSARATSTSQRTFTSSPTFLVDWMLVGAQHLQRDREAPKFDGILGVGDDLRRSM